MMQSTKAAAGQTAAAAAERGEQYLTFVCAGEEYAVEILRVQEIKGWDNVTRVPYVAPYVLGITNLRGVIVPVIDLRTRFNLEKRAFDASTVVIVVRVQSARGEKTVGIVVDGVSDVHSFAPEAIKPTPELGGAAGSACVRGLATVDSKMVMLLDVDALVAACVETAGTGPLNA